MENDASRNSKKLRKITKNNPEIENPFAFGIAYCSTKEHSFNAKIGRIKAVADAVKKIINEERSKSTPGWKTL